MYSMPSPKKPTILLLREKSTISKDPYEECLTEHNFDCLFVPVLEHCFVNLDKLKTSLIANSRDYSALVVTSKRAVDALGKIWGSIDESIKNDWTKKPTFTVGPSTANAVRKLGLIAAGENSGCAQQLGQLIISHYNNDPLVKPKLLFLVGDKRRDELPNIMNSASIPMDEINVYQTQLRSDLDECLQRIISNSKLDWVVLFSPSGSKAYDMISNRLSETELPRLAAIGETTSQHLKDRGYHVHAVADKPDAYHLTRAVVDKGF
ncbi:uroporphyrinogen-III synthase [Umbelopsis sp. WA50703]|jgi:uroporphyrinogen-III synthase